MTVAAPVALEQEIKAEARRLGFDLAGITTAAAAETGEQYLDWAAAGHAGEMGYMTRDPARRSDPSEVMPEARSIVVVGMLYNTGELDDAGRGQGESGPTDAPATPELLTLSPPPPRGRIARYALGADYHDALGEKLNALLAWIRECVGAEARGRAYVDTGPLLERDLARRAALGWFGMHPRLRKVR